MQRRGGAEATACWAALRRPGVQCGPLSSSASRGMIAGVCELGMHHRQIDGHILVQALAHREAITKCEGHGQLHLGTVHGSAVGERRLFTESRVSGSLPSASKSFVMRLREWRSRTVGDAIAQAGGCAAASDEGSRGGALVSTARNISSCESPSCCAAPGVTFVVAARVPPIDGFALSR